MTHLKRHPLCWPALLLLASLIGMASPAAAEIRTAQAVPWSGYWWPFHRGGLATGYDYRDHPAPLEKYDLLVSGAYPGRATDWYLQNSYDPDAPRWWGECADWAAAAVFEDDPFLPSSEDNILFRVGDKKGLMTQAHNNDIANRADGSRPETFHYWLLNYIGDQQKGFVADLDPGEEVWSYPIYQYDMTVEHRGSVDSVAVTVYYANDLVPPDFMGTEVRTMRFTYDLLLNEQGEITGGQWTGNSVEEYPNRLTFPLAQRSSNPYLDYAEVKRLAAARDDFLEDGNRAVAVSPGTYNLVLLDDDLYRIVCSPGDLVTLDVTRLEGGQEAITLRLTDADGYSVHEGSLGEAETAGLSLTAENPPYLLYLTQSDYTDPNLYTLTLDLQKSHVQQVPYLPKNGMWSGFALTNGLAVASEGVMLVSYDGDGAPLQTLLGPLTLAPGEKSTFFFSDLPWRRHEYSATERLVLLADQPVSILNLFGYSDSRMASFVQGTKSGAHVVIPDLKAPLSRDGAMFGAILNETTSAMPIQMRSYTEGGALFNEVETTLQKGQKIALTPGSAPLGNTPDGGWLDIQALGEGSLSGFEVLFGSNKLEALFALPVGGGRKILPHIPAPGDGWRTRVTLINPNDVPNRIVLHPARAAGQVDRDMEVLLDPYEKRVIDIQDVFGWAVTDPLYRSVVEIQGEYDVVGYYSYALANSSGDEASLPLLEEVDFGSELTLPHYPGRFGWWTGVGVFNPTATAQSVRVAPYDAGGRLIEALVTYRFLGAGAYDIMLVGGGNGARADEIAFVKFFSEAPEGEVGGFYLYGDVQNGVSGTRLFSGANM